MTHTPTAAAEEASVPLAAVDELAILRAALVQLKAREAELCDEIRTAATEATRTHVMGENRIALIETRSTRRIDTSLLPADIVSNPDVYSQSTQTVVLLAPVAGATALPADTDELQTTHAILAGLMAAIPAAAEDELDDVAAIEAPAPEAVDPQVEDTADMPLATDEADSQEVAIDDAQPEIIAESASALEIEGDAEIEPLEEGPADDFAITDAVEQNEPETELAAPTAEDEMPEAFATAPESAEEPIAEAVDTAAEAQSVDALMAAPDEQIDAEHNDNAQTEVQTEVEMPADGMTTLEDVREEVMDPCDETQVDNLTDAPATYAMSNSMPDTMADDAADEPVLSAPSPVEPETDAFADAEVASAPAPTADAFDFAQAPEAETPPAAEIEADVPTVSEDAPMIDVPADLSELDDAPLADMTATEQAPAEPADIASDLAAPLEPSETVTRIEMPDTPMPEAHVLAETEVDPTAGMPPMPQATYVPEAPVGEPRPEMASADVDTPQIGTPADAEPQALEATLEGEETPLPLTPEDIADHETLAGTVSDDPIIAPAPPAPSATVMEDQMMAPADLKPTGYADLQPLAGIEEEEIAASFEDDDSMASPTLNAEIERTRALEAEADALAAAVDRGEADLSQIPTFGTQRTAVGES